MKVSVKTIIVLLMILIILPFVVLDASILIRMTDAKKRHAEEKLFRTLEDIEKPLEHLMTSSCDLLLQIIQAANQQSFEESERLINLLMESLKDRYASAGLVDENGLVAKTFPPVLFSIDVSDRAWFQKVRSLKGPIVGHYLVERVTGQPGLVLARAVEKPDGSFGGAAFVVIRWTYLQSILTSFVLPPDAIATIRDSEGLVLARTLEPEKWIGKKLPEADIFQKISGRIGRASLQARGIDGIERIYVYSFIGGSFEQGGIYLSVGIPAEKVLEPVRRQAMIEGIIAAGVCLLAVIAGWLFGKRVILEPVDAIRKAVEEFIHNIRYRIPVSSSWPLELKSLAFAFNDMGDRLSESIRKYEESQTDLRRLVDQIPGILYRAEPDSPLSYIFVSSQIREFLGIEEAVEYPFPWFDVIHKEDKDRVLAEIKRFVHDAEATLLRLEYRVVDKSGIVKWVRDEAIKIYNGKKFVIQGIWRDISWRIRSDWEIRLLREALDRSSDGFVLVGSKGRILWANKAFLMMTECPDIQLCEEIKAILLPIIALDQAGMEFLKALEEGQAWRGRVRVFSKPDKEASVWDVSISLWTSKEDKQRKLLFFRDVTKEVSLQNQLFIAQKMESLGTLATGLLMISTTSL